jgi:hypothetical protein
MSHTKSETIMYSGAKRNKKSYKKIRGKLKGEEDYVRKT